MQHQSIEAHYNRQVARDCIDVLAGVRKVQAVPTSLNLSGELSLNGMKVVEEKSPRFYKLCSGADSQEYIFRVVGTLSFMDFPLTRMLPVNDRLRHRSQVAVLQGFGASSFQSAVSKLWEVIMRLERAMPDGSLQPLALDGDVDDVQLMFKCRYFTVGPDATRTPNVEIPLEADYKGILSSMVKKKGVRYGQGNCVVYRRAVDTSNDNTEYEPLSPISFRAGDIVEVEFSLLGVPLADGEVKCVLKQRTLTLLDETITLDAAMSENQHGGCNHIDPQASKRKADVEPEDVRETRRAVARINLGQRDDENTEMH